MKMEKPELLLQKYYKEQFKGKQTNNGKKFLSVAIIFNCLLILSFPYFTKQKNELMVTQLKSFSDNYGDEINYFKNKNFYTKRGIKNEG